MHLLQIVRVRIKYYIKILFVLSLVVMVWVGLFFVLFWFGFLAFFFHFCDNSKDTKSHILPQIKKTCRVTDYCMREKEMPASVASS